MSSTVTVSTVSTVASGVFFASFGLIVAVTLILLFAKKEIFSTSVRPWARALTKALNVAIIPLFMAFVLIAIFNVVLLFSK